MMYVVLLDRKPFTCYIHIWLENHIIYLKIDEYFREGKRQRKNITQLDHFVKWLIGWSIENWSKKCIDKWWIIWVFWGRYIKHSSVLFDVRLFCPFNVIVNPLIFDICSHIKRYLKMTAIFHFLACNWWGFILSSYIIKNNWWEKPNEIISS